MNKRGGCERFTDFALRFTCRTFGGLARRLSGWFTSSTSGGIDLKFLVNSSGFPAVCRAGLSASSVADLTPNSEVSYLFPNND